MRLVTLRDMTFTLRLQHVAAGEHTDHTVAVVDHGQPAHVRIGHGLHGLGDGGVGAHGAHRCVHQFGNEHGSVGYGDAQEVRSIYCRRIVNTRTPR